MPRIHRDPAFSGGLGSISRVSGPHPTGRPSEALRTFPGYTPRAPAGSLGVRNPVGPGYYQAPAAAPSPLDRSLTCRPRRPKSSAKLPPPPSPRKPSHIDPRAARFLRRHHLGVTP